MIAKINDNDVTIDDDIINQGEEWDKITEGDNILYATNKSIPECHNLDNGIIRYQKYIDETKKQQPQNQLIKLQEE